MKMFRSFFLLALAILLASSFGRSQNKSANNVSSCVRFNLKHIMRNIIIASENLNCVGFVYNVLCYPEAALHLNIPTACSNRFNLYKIGQWNL